MTITLVRYSFLIFLLIKYSSQYIERNIEDDDLCSLIKKRKIKLDTGPKSGLIVKQFRLNDHSIDWDRNFRCTFQVTPLSTKEGIIAVIQHLIFRKNSTTDECIDYIQFARKDGSFSPKICGRFNAAIHMDHNFIDPTAPIPLGNTMIDNKGELDVIIFVSKEQLKSHEEMDISIVFTAYRDCFEVLKRDSTYKPCSIARKEFCIFKGFFSDSYINCPLPDCRDEEGCTKPEIVEGSRYDGNKVLIGALSAVSITFLIFILCLWICKTYKIFCWSQSFANPNSTTPQDPTTASRVIEMNESTESRSFPAQEQNASANHVDEDKDLPPSYDSLFPTRFQTRYSSEAQRREPRTDKDSKSGASELLYTDIAD